MTHVLECARMLFSCQLASYPTSCFLSFQKPYNFPRFEPRGLFIVVRVSRIPSDNEFTPKRLLPAASPCIQTVCTFYLANFLLCHVLEGSVFPAPCQAISFISLHFFGYMILRGTVLASLAVAA